MKNGFLIALAGILLLCQACTTAKLWEDTEPQVWIDASQITEAELKERGVPYRVYRSSIMNGYLVDKSTREKMKGYHLRMLGTPVTLTIDAAGTAVAAAVVGVYLFPEGACELLNHACN